MERNLLAASIKNREAFDILHSRGVDKDLSPPAAIIFESIGAYYAKDIKAGDVGIDLLGEYLKQNFPKHASSLIGIIDELPKEVSTNNAVELWLASKRKAVGNRLASALIENTSDKIHSLLDEYQFYTAYSEETPRTFQGISAQELLAEEQEKGLIPLFPRSLNDAIGGGVDPRGTHIVVFGRPDSGKTQFNINAAAKMVQSGYKVLYCGNEDPIKKVLLRFISRLADMDLLDVKRSPQDAFERAVNAGYNNLIYHEIIPGTIGEIRGLIEKHRPDVVFIDQIRNLKIADTFSLTQILERAVIELRTLAKAYGCVIVSVTQAGESAHGKVALAYNDVEHSNTGVAAQADLMIGVAVNEELYLSNKLVLCICKNKMNDAYPQLPVRVNRARSKLASDL